VQLPLALPVIIAGVRIATVTTIGLVTITGLIGYGGFGFFIFAGLRSNLYLPKLLVGALAPMVMALVADGLLQLLERALTPWSRRSAA
jgi:osmoprotectant transport system permease protein